MGGIATGVGGIIGDDYNGNSRRGSINRLLSGPGVRVIASAGHGLLALENGQEMTAVNVAMASVGVEKGVDLGGQPRRR